jgi:uncharacterized membrane protein
MLFYVSRVERYSDSMTKKSASKKRSLTLHSLLGALSFWGTASRTFLFSFLAAAVFAAALTEATTDTGIDREVMLLIYVLGSFVLLDFGYVLVARAYPMQKALDLLTLVAADIFLAVIYIVPKLVVSAQVNFKNDPLLFILFIPLVVLALRMLVGILFGGRRR